MRHYRRSVFNGIALLALVLCAALALNENKPQTYGFGRQHTAIEIQQEGNSTTFHLWHYTPTLEELEPNAPLLRLAGFSWKSLSQSWEAELIPEISAPVDINPTTRPSEQLNADNFATSPSIAPILLGDLKRSYHTDALGFVLNKDERPFEFSPNLAMADRSITVPNWFLAALAAAVPLIYLWRWLQTRVWMHTGTCALCGYDLRATPERCPECGNVPLIAGCGENDGRRRTIFNADPELLIFNLVAGVSFVLLVLDLLAWAFASFVDYLMTLGGRGIPVNREFLIITGFAPAIWLVHRMQMARGRRVD